MPRVFVRFLAGFLFLVTGISLLGQQLLKPQSVRFAGTVEYTSDELLSATGIKVGQTYTSDYLGQSAQSLMAIGVFEKVGYKFDGAELTYLMSDSPDLYPIIVDNLPLDAGKDLDAKLRQRVPLYHGKVPSEGAMLDNVRQALEAMLADEGLQVKVTSVPAGDSPNRKATAIKFRIDSTPVRVGVVNVTGVSAELQPQMPKPSAWVNLDYQTADTAETLEQSLTSSLFSLGYAAAHVHAYRRGNPVTTSDSIRVPFTVEIQQGKTYKLGTVEIARGVPVSAADFGKEVRPRDEYSPENRYMAALFRAVQFRLKEKGYLDSKVTLHPAIDESAGTVNYTIDASTGPQYHLALIKFENVSNELRSLLMRTWQMMPGDPFDESYVVNFLNIAQGSDPVLRRTLAGVKVSYDVHADPQSHDVNLVIHLARE